MEDNEIYVPTLVNRSVHIFFFFALSVRSFFNFLPYEIFVISTNSTGTTNIARVVAAIIPPNTVHRLFFGFCRGTGSKCQWEYTENKCQ